MLETETLSNNPRVATDAQVPEVEDAPTSNGDDVHVESDLPAAPADAPNTASTKTADDGGVGRVSLPAIERAVVGRVISTLMTEASSATFGADDDSESPTRRDVVRSDLVAWCQLVGQLRPQISAFWAHLKCTLSSSVEESDVREDGSVRSLLLDWVRVETCVALPLSLLVNDARACVGGWVDGKLDTSEVLLHKPH